MRLPKIGCVGSSDTENRGKSRPTTDEFAEVLRKARAREPNAVDALWSRYQRRVRGLIARRLSPLLRVGYDTDDIAQSVFAEMLRDLPRFEDRGEECFRHWLYIKAENKVRGKLRKALRTVDARDRGSPRDGAEGDPQAPSAGDEEATFLRVAVEGMDAGARAVIRLRHEQGLGYEEIAACLGLASPEAARKRHARALVALRDRLARPGKEGPST
jgi:RNA polymerase sigma factor (sigma-70 family)